MIGNDIIDIHQTRLNSNWQRKGFLQKVFNSEEQKFINSASDPFLTVWHLWSMKESAYKVLLQNGTARFFNPTKLSCNISSPQKGSVSFNGLNLHTQTTFNTEYIHTLASFEVSDIIECNIFHLAKSDSFFQSKVTHQKLLNYVAVKNNLRKDQLKINKSATQIPAVFYKDQKLDCTFSLSHHGNYGAFSILNN